MNFGWLRFFYILIKFETYDGEPATGRPVAWWRFD